MTSRLFEIATNMNIAQIVDALEIIDDAIEADRVDLDWKVNAQTKFDEWKLNIQERV